ncbi:sulfite exporter TauE/SafE family protein [Paraconexibacter sp.]|uniref:sulfite exporter TauE/SafE family protein n=1 Tax=Paraconexibacter sp. TaxID=2949640 RepID=UPI00356531AD
MLGIDLVIVLFGLGVGILVGLTGIGGGSLMTPLLVLFAGISPVVAIGTDLAYGAVTKTLGGWKHWRSGTVDMGVSKWLAVGSVPGSLLGVVAVDLLHERYGKGFDKVLLAGIAVALVIVAVTILTRALFMPKLVERERDTVELTNRVRGGAAGIGLVLGFVVGLTSVGSGALIGLALILIFRLTPHRVVGTDVFHAAILLWSAGLAHWVGGNVDFGLMGTILIGSLPGVWIGTHLLPRVPAAGLRPALGCVLLASALGVSTKAGLELPAYGILAPPLLIGAAAFLLQRRRSRLAVRPTTEVAPA